MPSKLVPVSLGQVAAHKVLNSVEIEVYPIEHSPIASGELNSTQGEYKATVSSKAGATNESVVATSATWKAEWLPIGDSNRQTAPDVRRGELVMIYQFADRDKYYWATLASDLNFRKLETVVWAFSATKEEGATPNSDNCYFIEISTHKGLIHIHTTQKNGEYCGYDIQLNTKEGRFVIADTVGNELLLDSTENQFRLTNASGSVIDLHKLILSMKMAEKISMQTKNYEVNAENMSMSGKALNIKANTTNDGNVDIKGSMSQKGGNGAAFGGNVTMEGNVRGNATISARHIASDTRIDAPG